MARAKTKSEPITFRLSMDAYAEALRRSTAQGLSVNEWMRRQIEEQLVKPRPGARTARPSEVTPNFPPRMKA